MTFADIWRPFFLEHSNIDPLLCRQWVLQAYKRACTSRQWGFMRASGELTNADARAVTVSVTQGLTAVTSAAAFIAADGGRQFRVGGLGIPYTLTFVDASNVTLDRAYQGDTSAAAEASIFDAYVALPEDVDSIRSLINPTSYLPMPWFVSAEYLDYYDPNRMATNAYARMLCPRQMSTVTGQTNRMWYEWWPYPTARQSYPIQYYRRPDSVADTDEMVGVLATRGEDLLHYARYRAALYPGTAQQKNPAYNPVAARMHLEEWDRSLSTLAVRDDDQFTQSIETIDWRWVLGGLPYDDTLLRASDASGYGPVYGGYSGYVY